MSDSQPHTLTPAQVALATERFYTESLDILCILDPEGRILGTNQAILRTLGYHPADVVGRYFGDFIYPDDLPSAGESFGQLQSGRDTVQFRVRCTHRNGSTRWMECTCPALQDGAMAYYAICRDVTAHKQAEDQRDESISRHAAALRIAGSTIYEWDTATDEMMWAGSCAAMLGYADDEMPKTLEDWLELIHPQDRRDAQRAARQLLPAAEPASLEYRVRHKDGAYIDVRDNAQFFRDAAGKRRKMIGFVTDISAMRQSEQRFQQAIQAAPIGLLIVDTDGVIRFLNPQGARIFGYDRDELRGQNVDMLVPDAVRERHSDLRRQYAQDPSSRMLGEGRHLAGKQKDGGEVPVEIGLGPLPTAEESLVVCTIVDRREQVAAERAVEQSEQQLRDILDNTTSVIYVKDNDGRYLLVNRRFEDLFGLDREAVKGRTDHEIFPAEMAEDFRRNDAAVAQSGAPLQMEEQAPHDDGMHTYVSVKFPLFDAAGAVYAIAGISTDISDRLAGQAAKREMATAQTVQQLLYPKQFPAVPGFDIGGAVVPASMLCGDYLDFIPAGEDAWLIAVGDICGHGLGPALQMVGARAYLRALVARQGPQLRLRQTACQLNEFLLSDIPVGSFLTMYLVLLKPGATRLEHFGAGHDAILVRNDRVQQIGSSSLVLGLSSDLLIDPVEPLELRPGDVLVAATDGAAEACNANDEQFGRQRLYDVIGQNRHKSAAEIVQAIRQAVEQFADGCPQADDVTMAVIKAD